MWMLTNNKHCQHSNQPVSLFGKCLLSGGLSLQIGFNWRQMIGSKVGKCGRSPHQISKAKWWKGLWTVLFHMGFAILFKTSSVVMLLCVTYLVVEYFSFRMKHFSFLKYAIKPIAIFPSFSTTSFNYEKTYFLHPCGHSFSREQCILSASQLTSPLKAVQLVAQWTNKKAQTRWHQAFVPPLVVRMVCTLWQQREQFIHWLSRKAIRFSRSSWGHLSGCLVFYPSYDCVRLTKWLSYPFGEVVLENELTKYCRAMQGERKYELTLDFFPFFCWAKFPYFSPTKNPPPAANWNHFHLLLYDVSGCFLLVLCPFLMQKTETVGEGKRSAQYKVRLWVRWMNALRTLCLTSCQEGFLPSVPPSSAKMLNFHAFWGVILLLELLYVYVCVFIFDPMPPLSH